MGDLVISAVEAIPLKISGDTHFAISEGRANAHFAVLLILRTDDENIYGFSEIACAPPGKPEEIPGEIFSSIENYIRPALLGTKATHLNQAVQLVKKAIKGKNWTKAATNVALHDLWAKSQKQSLLTMLGGEIKSRIPVIGDVIGIMSPDAMAEAAAYQVGRGVKTLKIKVGETVATDVDRVKAVRKAVGNDVSIRVDANNHFVVAEAVSFINKIEHCIIEHVEQPIGRFDLLGMRNLRKKVNIPITTDDMVASIEDAMNVIRLDAADRIKVKVTKHGLTDARAIAKMARAAGLEVILGHVFQTGLGAVAEAHLAASCTEIRCVNEIGSLGPIGVKDDLIAESLRREAGYIEIPVGPGLGVTLNWSTIDKYRYNIGDY